MKRPPAPASLLPLLASLLFTAFLPAEEETSKPVQALTWHGEALSGTLSLKQFRVITKYGPLEIPFGEVVRIDFAPTASESDKQRFLKLVEDLKVAASRAASHREIVAMGPAALKLFPLAGKGQDEALREVLNEVAQEIRESVGRRNLEDDVIVARRFTVLGQVELDDVTLGSTYGSLRVRRSDLDRLVFSGQSSQQDIDKILIFKIWTDQDEEFVRTQDAIARRTKLRMAEFSRPTAAELKKALLKFRVVVIPELEEPDPSMGQVATESGPALRKFVQDGGVIVCCGGEANIQLLTQSGLVPCSGGSDGGASGSITRKHPILQGVSGAIPYANATFPIRVTSNRKMQALVTASSGGIVVGIAKMGVGAVIYCGWDFYESGEPHQKILANAVRWAATQGVGSMEALR